MAGPEHTRRGCHEVTSNAPSEAEGRVEGQPCSSIRSFPACQSTTDDGIVLLWRGSTSFVALHAESVIVIVTHASRAELSFAATIHVLEVDVADDPKRAVDEVASDVDDLTTKVEELEVDPAADEHAKELGRLRLALEEASAAADAVEENMDEEEDERSHNH